MKKIYLFLMTVVLLVAATNSSFANKFAPTGLTSAGGATYVQGYTASVLTGTITKTSCATGAGSSVTGTLTWYYNTTNTTTTTSATVVSVTTNTVSVTGTAATAQSLAAANEPTPSTATVGTRYYFWTMTGTSTCGAAFNLTSPTTAVTVIAHPSYASLPFTESFESSWSNFAATADQPSANWVNYPATGNDAWRREDDGSGANTAGWTSPTLGAYSVAASAGSHSARFHEDYATSGTTGGLYLYVNLPSGTKTIFWDFTDLDAATTYNNIQVQVSTDGGTTWATLQTVYGPGTSTWVTESTTTTATSSTAIIRWLATSDYCCYDMGIDNIKICLNPTVSVSGTPGCVPAAFTASGATTYTWAPSTSLTATTGATVTASPTVSTTYTVTGTTGYCSGTTTATANPAPTFTSTVSAVCAAAPNNTYTFTATPSGGTFYVVPGTGTATIGAASGVLTGTSAGTVTVSYVKSGCSVTTPVTISPLPTVSVSGAQPYCNYGGSPVALTVSGTGTSYSWAPGASLDVTTGSVVNASPSSSTTYTVTSTLGSCSAKSTAVVPVHNQANLIDTTLGGGSTCIPGTVPYFAWSVYGSTLATGGTYSSSDTTVATVTSAGYVSGIGMGTATITYSDAYCLTQTMPVRVNGYGFSIAVTPSSANYCTSGGPVHLSVASITGGVTADTFAWLPNYAIDSPSYGNVNVSPAATVTYTVYATNNTSGCHSDTTITITNVTPAAITGGVTSMCSGQTTTWTDATGGGTWSSDGTGYATIDATSGVVTAVSVGTTVMTYTVAATGCYVTRSVTVNGTPTPSISASAGTLCLGSASSLTASGGSTYTWSPATYLSATTGGSVVSTPTAIGTTTYTVTATSAAGCTATATQTVNAYVVPAIAVSPSSATICAGGSHSITATVSPTYTILSQNFNSSLTDSTGGTWTITNGAGNSTTWFSLRASPGYISAVTGDGSQYMEAAPDALTTITRTQFQSPAFSTLGLTSASLKFSHYYDYYSGDSTANIAYSTNGGTTWTVITDYKTAAVAAGATTWTVASPNVTIALPAGALNKASVLLKWNYVSTFGFYWAIDNIRLTGTLSSVPSATWSPTTGLYTNLGLTTPYTGTALATVYASPSSSTTYTASVGTCAATGTSAITVNPLPTVSVSPSNGCYGVAMTASGASTYTWSPSTGLSATTGATVTPTPGSATTYTVTGVSAAGCSGTATKLVNMLPTVSVTPSPASNVVCSGGSTVSLSASGASTYSWSPSTGLSATTGNPVGASPAANTVYTVTGVDVNGCQNTQTDTVVYNITPTTITGASTTLCLPGSMLLSTDGTGGTWSSSDSTIATIDPISGLVTGLDTGAVTLSYTNPTCGGVTYAMNVADGGFTVMLSPTSGSYCSSGSPLNVTASGATSYSWSPSAGLDVTTGATVNASPTVTTTYTVVGTTGACSNSGTVMVTNTTPAAIAGGVTSLCSGQTTTWTDTTGGGTWSSSGLGYATIDATTGVITAVSAGVETMTYTVASTGCYVTRSITVNATPTPTVSASSSVTCLGTAVTLTAGGGSTYSWAPSTYLSATTGSSPTCTPTATGSTIYTVTVTSPAGCTATATQSVGAYLVSSISVAPASTSICSGGTVMLTSSVSATPTLLWQNFNTGLTDSTGGTWTIVNGSGNSSSWFSLRASPGYVSAVTGDGSQYMEASPDALTTLTQTRFKSPSFSTVGLSAATLTFSHYYDYYSADATANVSYSTDGGTTWVVIVDYFTAGVSAGSTSWTVGSPNVTLALPAGALGHSNVQLRWQYNSTFGFYWAVDNIRVTGVSNSLPSTTWSPTTNLYTNSGATIPYTGTATDTVYAVGVSATTYTASVGSCAASGTSNIAVGPLTASVTNPVTVCSGSTGTWTITGLSGATVYYNINSGTTSSVVLTGGTGTVSTSVTVNDTLNLISITSGTCSNSLTGSYVIKPYCVCTPSYYYYTLYGTSSYYASVYAMNHVQVNGYSGSTLNDLFTPTNAGYSDRTSVSPVTLREGDSYSGTVTYDATYYYYENQIWIDFNDDGTFAASEAITPVFGTPGSSIGSSTFTITMPTGMTTGSHRMRVRNAMTYLTTLDASMSPCADLLGTSYYYYGSTADYQVTVLPPPPAITATPSSLLFPPTTTGTTSSTLSFNLAGTYLLPTSGNINLTAPTGFQISSTGTGGWGSSLTVAYTGATLSSTPIYVQFTPSTATTYSDTIGITGGGITTSVKDTVKGTGAAPCAGTPTAGIAWVSPVSGNATTAFTLTDTGYSVAGGIHFQWQSSSDSVTWTNIVGATTSIYSFTGITANTYYRCVDTCTYTGYYAHTYATMAQFLPTPTCIPTSASWYSESSYSYGINNIAITGYSGSTLSDAGLTSTPLINTTTGYVARYGTVPTLNLQQNGTYTASLTWGTSGSDQDAQIWIDFNNDGTFQTSEEVMPEYWSAAAPATITPTVTIPLTANTGTHLMRVRGMWELISSDISGGPGHIDPCAEVYPGVTLTSFSGSIADYYVNIVPLPPCSGTPTGGTASASVTSGCSGYSSVLSLTGSTSASGLTYQWYLSTNGGSTYAAVSGATSPTYTVTVTSPSDMYYCTITCTASGLSANSSTVTIHSTPAITGGTTVCQAATDTLANGLSGGTWSSSATGVATVDATTGVVTGASTAGVATISYVTTGCTVTYNVTNTLNPTTITGATHVCNTLATTLADAVTGGVWSSSDTTKATVGSSTGIVTGTGVGVVTISYSNGCGTPATKSDTILTHPVAISSAASLCATGGPVTLVDSTAAGTWSNSPTTIGTVDASTGVFTPTGSVGTSVVTYTIGLCSVTQTLSAGTAAPAAITGTTTVCAASATTLANAVGGGLWSSSNPAVATVDATTGIVTGVNGGTDTITYNNGCGIATTAYTVNGTSVTMGYNTGVCTGATLSLTSGTLSGGTYSWTGPNSFSSTLQNPTISSVTSAAIGTYSFSATVGGCTTGTHTEAVTVTTAPTVTVTASPATVCAGTPSTLSSSTVTTLLSQNFNSGLTGLVGGTWTVTNSGASSTYNWAVNAPSYYTDWAGTGDGSNLIGADPDLAGSGVNINTVLNAPAFSTVGMTSATLAFNYYCYSSSTYDVTADIEYSTNGTTWTQLYNYFNTTSGTKSWTAGTPTQTINLPTLLMGQPTVYLRWNYNSTFGWYWLLDNVVVNGTSNTPASVWTPSTSLYTNSGLTTSYVGGSTSSTVYAVPSSTVTYTATVGSCAATGNATVTVNPMPTIDTVTGTGSYCSVPGTGLHVGLSGSQVGVTYKLYRGATLVTTMSGTGSALDFGADTAGVYTVVASYPSSGCTQTMADSAVITKYISPTSYTVTSLTGCTNPGVAVNLSGSSSAVSYQLYNGITPVGSASTGTGSSMAFGTQTTAGTYTIIGTGTTGGCQTTMTGAVTVNQSPAVYSVTGSTACSSTGSPIGVSSSDTGVNYTLYNSGTSVTSMSGTGSALSYGTETAVGSYAVVATGVIGGCQTNMNDTIQINQTPSLTIGATPNVCVGNTSASQAYSGAVGSPTTYSITYDGTAHTAGFGDITSASFPGGGVITEAVPSTAPAATYTGTLTVSNASCTSANYTINVNVIAYPTAAITSATPPCMGYTTSVVFTGTTGAVLDYVAAGDTLNTVVSGGSYTLTTGTLTSATNYELIDIHEGTGTCYSIYDSIITINPVPMAWTGASDTDWNNGANWSCGFVPTVSDDVSIPSGTTYAPSLAASGSGTTRNLSIASGVTLKLYSSSTLNVKGTLANNSTVSGAGTLSMSGSTAQHMQGMGYVSNLDINNTAGVNVDSGARPVITGALSLSGGMLSTGDSVVLNSDSTNGTARIAPITTGGAGISGKVQVRQYVANGHRAYRFWSHPFSSSISLSQIEKFIDVTGDSGSIHGFTNTFTNSPSAFWYNPMHANSGMSYDPGWNPFHNALPTGNDTDMVHPYQGLRLFIRGSKGEGLTYPTTGPYTVDPATVGMSGPVNQGTQVVHLQKGTGANQDYNQIGNPYASPVNIGSIAHTAWANGQITGSAIFLWNPYIIPSGNWVSVNVTTGTPYYMEAYTSFQVRAAANGDSLVFHETDKASGSSASLLRSAPGYLSLAVYDVNYQPWDMLRIQFNDQATDNEDNAWDAVRPSGPSGMNFYAWSADEKKMAIDGLPYADGKVIPLGLTSGYAQDFIMKVQGYDVPAGGQVYLHDKLLNQYTKLTDGMEYRFTITSDKATQGDNRFELRLGPVEAAKVNGLDVTMTPNPATDMVNIAFTSGKPGETKIRMTDVSGVSVYNKDLGIQQQGSVNIPLDNFAAGIYMVELTNGDQKVVQRLVKE